MTARTRVILGNGAIDRLGDVAAAFSPRCVLIVTDPGILAAGHVATASAALTAAGLESVVFDRVRENPTTADVAACLEAACLEAASTKGVDLIIGLGGGSSMDTAKGCNFLLTNGGEIKDYWGSGKATAPMLPMIAVPTTAGTGSEVQSYALIADDESHQKMACGDPKAAPRIALLDPELTLTQPDQVTAVTGIDAITHAVECAVTSVRVPASLALAGEAFGLLSEALPVVMQAPTDLRARAGMLLGAAKAGAAIEASMLGAAHAAANPLTAHFGIVHGYAVGTMLPHVVRFNGRDPDVAQAYADWLGTTDVLPGSMSPEESVSWLLQRLDLFLGAARFENGLATKGMTQEHIPALAEEAAAQWTAQFNPRPVSAADFEELYRQALHH